MARYAEIEDLYRYGAPKETFEGLAAEEVLVPALNAATLMVDNYLGAAVNEYGNALYAVPLTVWGQDIRRAASVIAAWEIVRMHRVRPGEPLDENPIYLAYKEVLAWLRALGKGDIAIVGVEPEPGEPGTVGIGVPLASSNAQRGYHEGVDWGSGDMAFIAKRGRW